MTKINIMTIVGTRPEIIRLSEVIRKCDKYFKQILVHTGQNYDYRLNQIFFEELDLRQPDYYLGVVGDNQGETLGNIISRSYKLMKELNPDAVLILGDTNSALSAISASRLKIPIFHMEAGNRCFDENLPEEINRKIVDHISDINMCYSEQARKNLLEEGFPSENIIVVGSPMSEVLNANLNGIMQSSILEKLKLCTGKYILLSAHREENIDNDKNFAQLMEAINAVAESYQVQIIYSMHPRSKKFILARKFEFNPLVRCFEPFGFFEYNKLQINSLCVISDSGTLPEESSFFISKGIPFPAISIRTSTERVEAMDKGNFMLGGIEKEQLLETVNMAIKMQREGDFGTEVPNYSDNEMSSCVVKILMMYLNKASRLS